MYFITFERPYIDIRSAIVNGKASILCPHCGLPLKSEHENVCEYCYDVIDHTNFTWLMSDIEELNSNSKIDNLSITNEQQF